MSKRTRDIELLRHIDNHLMIQYEELHCLRAQLAGLLFPIKPSPPRKRGNTRNNRSVPVERSKQAMSRALLLLIQDR
jgi:hypothetical protein